MFIHIMNIITTR